MLADAQGRARRLNLLADKALLAAFADGKKQVGVKQVRIAIQESGANFSSASFKPDIPWQAVAAGLFSLVLAFIAGIWLFGLLK